MVFRFGSLMRFASGCLLALLVAPLAQAQHPAETPEEAGTPPHEQSLAAIGAKLNDPTSDVWALQAEFDALALRGRATDQEYEWGGVMLFQPVLPFELTEHWKLLTRPVLTFVFSAPIPKAAGPGRFHRSTLISPSATGPTGDVTFDSVGGFGDIVLP